MPQLYRTYYPALMDFAQRFARVRGPLRPIPLPVILRAFIGLFFSYSMTELIIGSQLPAELKEHAFDHFVDIFLHGVLAKG